MNVYDYYITPDDYERAAVNGIKKATLEYRIRRAGWDKERAINTKARKREKLPQDILDIASANGISLSTLTRRINRGWDMELACTEKPIPKSENAVVQSERLRKYPKDMLDLARSNGIQIKTFHSRIRAGWDIHEAATRKPMSAKERMDKANKLSNWRSDHSRYVDSRKGGKVNAIANG